MIGEDNKIPGYKMVEQLPGFKLVDREIPGEVEKLPFYFKDSNFGGLNLCCWKEEISQVKDPVRIVLEEEEIEINFPIFERFYVQFYRSEDGFTFYDLVNLIAKTGAVAFKWDINDNPDRYEKNVTRKDILGEYTITNTGIKIGSKSLGRRPIYLSLQH